MARGAKAYFDSINAKGGVAKRKIEYKIVDDGYNPAQTVQAVRRLVEQDRVFAVFNTLGTEHNLAIRDYLNQMKVPQLFAASGATTWGRDAAKYPWTIGFQPSYAAEGWVYGQYVAKTQRKAKIAVLFQNDDYGKDLLGGLKRGLALRVEGDRRPALPGDVPDVGSQIAKLKASGANVLAIFATPTFAIQAYVPRTGLAAARHQQRGVRHLEHHAARLRGWEEQGCRGHHHEHDPQRPDRPALEERPGMKLYRSLMGKYADGENVNDVYHVYGMAVAYETVGLLRRLGANPTRAALMIRARSITSAGTRSCFRACP